MALYGVRISDGHARNLYHVKPISRDVSQGSNLGHGRGTNLSWPIDASHGQLWPYMECELLLMMDVTPLARAAIPLVRAAKPLTREVFL